MKEGRAITPVAAANKEPPAPTIEETMSVSIPQLKVLTQGSTSSAMVLISKHTGTRIKKEPKPRKEKENETVSSVADKSEAKDKNEDEEEGEDGEGGREGGEAAAQSTSSVSSGSAVENGDGGDGGVQVDVEVPSSTLEEGEQGGQEETLVKIYVSGTDEKAVLAAVAALREIGEKQTTLNDMIARLKTEFPAFRSGHGGRPNSGGGSGRGGGGSRGNKRGGGNSSKPRGGGGVNGSAGAGASAPAPST